MKISIFLIIGFTNFVFSSDQNITDYDSHSVCPVKIIRRKRAIKEYTRWRSNIESTPEFIVKILDDDLPTPRTNKVIAVNIQPSSTRAEKIIIGGVMVTTPISKVQIDLNKMKDYTRFVRPTTVATVVENQYLAPIKSGLSPILGTETFSPKNFRARNPQRDESPPASPQFLPRSSVGVHQYAPITPVVFTRRSMISPLTPPPPEFDNNLFRKSILKALLRTTPFEDIVIPTRTTNNFDEFGNLEDNDQDITRTTLVTENEPKRTELEFKTTPTTEYFNTPTRATKNEFDEEKKNDNRDDAYAMMFYNYDDEGGGKKAGKTVVDMYDDTPNDQKEQQFNETYTSNDTVIDSETAITRETDITNNADIANITDTSDSMTLLKVQEEHTDSYQDNEILEQTGVFRPRNESRDTLPITTPGIELTTKKNTRAVQSEKDHKICSMVKLRELNFNSPRTLPEIEAKLKQWAENSPVCKWVDITDGNLTTMERPIYMMMVDDPSSGQIVSAKQTVMIVAGIQGRDQHAVAAAMYVLYQLIERSDSHPELLKKYRFWIIPVLNPDGYDYAMTFPHRREWTKNLRQNWDNCKGRETCKLCEKFGLRCTIQPCYGVNLDRNFEYQWIPPEELRAEHPCGSLFAGVRQLSETETSAFTKYLRGQHRPLYAFIVFKEGDVLGVMYPYSHTRKKRAYEHIYKKRASRAAAAAYSISGRPYVAGQTSQFLPLYAGGIEDWVDGHLGVDNTYTIMMFRNSDTYNSKLIAERVVHEAFAAMDTLVLQSDVQPAAALPPPVAVTGTRSFNDDSSGDTTSISNTLLAFATVVYSCIT